MEQRGSKTYTMRLLLLTATVATCLCFAPSPHNAFSGPKVTPLFFSSQGGDGGRSRFEGMQREPTAADLAVIDDDTTKLSDAKPYELPNAVPRAIRVVSSPQLFKDIDLTSDGREVEKSADVEESTSVKDVHKISIEQSEADDEGIEKDKDSNDDDNVLETVSENAADIDAESIKEFGVNSRIDGMGIVEDSEGTLPEVRNDSNDGNTDYSINRLDDNSQVSDEMDKSEEFVTDATNFYADELRYGNGPLSTAYHRIQTIEGETNGGNDEVPVIKNEATVDMLQENGEGVMSDENDSKENVLPAEGNNTNATEESPDEEDTKQIPPIQGWDDTDEGSFFEMMQSTFNVLLLAAFLTSMLILRKRVVLRLNTDPTLSMSDAIKDELVNFVLKIKSWVANAVGNAVRKNGTNVEGRSNSLTRTNGSFRAETTPLSTAVDEEWGWGDDDGGQRLELSAIGGDEEKEDEDLALALAMSLSESHTDRDDFNSSLTPLTTTANKRVNKKSPPAKTSNSSTSRVNSSASREETQRKSFTSQPPSSAFRGSDSIEDLLGQIGGSGGPMITSLGQKLQATSKPKQAQKNGKSDDIFDSMGLSIYPSITTSAAAGGWQAPTGMKSKGAAPKSAPVQSLLAETIDADTDSWGDNGDLDDLLDD